MTNVRHNALDATSRKLSVNLWRGAQEAWVKDPSNGFFFFDDFLNTPVLSTTATTGLYNCYADASNTILQGKSLDLSEGELGILEMVTDATDNDGPVIQAGGTGVMAMLSDTAAQLAEVYFEARFKKSSIADNGMAVFLGLSEEALAVDNGVHVDDTGALSDKDHIGFNTLQADEDALLFSYSKDGDGAATATIDLDSGSSALTADEWVKVGFRYQPRAKASERIAIFVDGLEQTNYVTSTKIAAATFPDGEELTLTAALKNGGAAAMTLSLDWWALGVNLDI